MNYCEKIILFLFCIILIIIIYKIYINDIYDIYDDIDDNKYIEHFKSSLSKIKNKKSKSFFKNIPNLINNDNDNDNDNGNGNSRGKKSTFDDIMKISENFKKEKDKVNTLAESIYNYKNSFNNKKFKNNSKDTAEAFAKFPLFKKKFFEIFK